MSGVNLVYKCRNCDNEFHPQGIKNHELRCLPIYTPRTDFPENASPFPSGEKQPPSARFEFPKMLYAMLEDTTFDEELCKIVSWQSHGLAFKVHDREEMEKILPKWFREKYESWRCLLEQWGFLKLTRGQDRGCWYHKNFIHRSSYLYSKNKYENLSKKEFLDGMPDHLSKREEPDLEKLSTLENRITPKQRKRKATLASRDSIDSKSSKVEKVPSNPIDSKERSNDKVKNTNNTSNTHKECRHCHLMFKSQRLKRHKKSCAMRMDNIESEDKEEAIAIPDMGKCRFCNKMFSKYGIKKHETACMRVQAEKQTSNDDNEIMELENEEVDVVIDQGVAVTQDLTPCKYCGNFFSKYGLKNHETACMRADDGNNNGQKVNSTKKSGKGSNRGPTLSDDSSVTSTESGCQVCGFDDDHANLLLCEGCETELHTYCLDPPLEKVPEGDWFCGKNTIK